MNSNAVFDIITKKVGSKLRYCVSDRFTDALCERILASTRRLSSSTGWKRTRVAQDTNGRLMSYLSIVEFTEIFGCSIRPNTNLVVTTRYNRSRLGRLLLRTIFDKMSNLSTRKTLHDDHEENSRNVKYSCWGAVG